jgi:putative tricarboxylic transport membrane protein
MQRLQRISGFETAVTAGLGLVGLYLVAEGVRLGLGSISVPEAGSFTFLAGVALTVLSVLHLFARRAAPPEYVADPEVPGAGHRVVALFAALAIYTAVLDVVGFVVATVPLSAAIMKLSHRPSWRAVCAVSIGAPVIVYVVFDVLLGVSLPAGTLFQR